MAHHFTGDINGTFWPGIQPCDDADFFGQSRLPPDPRELCYDFNRADLAEIEAGLETCREQLGFWKQQLDAFFGAHTSYDDEMLADHIRIHLQAFPSLLAWYARLRLGEDIRRSVVETGACAFSAEL